MTAELRIYKQPEWIYTESCGVMRMDAYVVGKVIRQLREKRGKSQELLSGLAGIGRTHLSAIERGTRRPTLETFALIAWALEMKPSALMAEIEQELSKE